MTPAVPISEWLANVSASRGDAPALIGIDRPNLSYEHLVRQVGVVAGVLRDHGIASGDVVVIALPDGPEALVAILAATSVATAFPIGAADQPERYERLIGEVTVRAIICQQKLGARLASIAAARQVALLTMEFDPSGPAGVFGLVPWADKAALLSGRGAGEPKSTDTAVLIGTSGSTATPKIVSVSHASLHTSVAQFAAWLSLSSEDRSLCVMPLGHLHALLRSTLPALFSGGSVICAKGFDKSAVLWWIEHLRPTYLTAAPSIYRQLLQLVREVDSRDWSHRLRFLVTGSDTIDDPTVKDIEAAFGVQLKQFYVLSETAPLVAMTPREAVPVPAGAVGRINPPWSVISVDEGGRMEPPGTEGEIAVVGGFMNPLLAGSQRLTSDGRLLTGDRGFVDDEGFLSITGRVDDRIHRGGEKISPREVEQALLQHPAIQRAVAFGIPDAILGQRVGVAVIHVAGAQVSTTELQSFMASRLASYMVPEEVMIVSELPTNNVGKISRANLAAVFGLVEPERQATPMPAPVGDRNKVRDQDIEGALSVLFCRGLKLAELDRHKGFFDLGGDSFGAVQLLFEIEDQFGVRIPPATFTSHSSLSLLAGVIRHASRSAPSARVQPLRTEGRFPPLFVAYNVEGNVGYGDAIRGALGPNQPLYAFNTLASRNDVAKPERLEEQATALVECMRSVQLQGPYHLIGYSFGSHLALEIAQQIFDLRDSVAFLGVIDDSADLGRRQFGIDKRPPMKLTTEACNRWALQRYAPKPYPGKITLFRASEPAEIYQSDPLAGWGEIALGGVEAHDIPGDHESVVTSEGFRWGPLLEICLAKARHRTSTLGRRLESEASKAVRHARSIVTNKGARHPIDARVAAKQGDRQSEIREYRRALQTSPAQPIWVQRNLAEALIENGDAAGGLALYEAALTADPWPFWGLVQLANLKLSLNRPSEIQALYERGRELVADDPDIMRHWGHLCTLAGKLDEAESAIRRAIVLERRKVYSQNYLGDLHGYLSDIMASRGQLAEALGEASEAARIDPKDPKKLARVAKLQARTVKLDAAPNASQKRYAPAPR